MFPKARAMKPHLAYSSELNINNKFQDAGIDR